MSLLMCKMDRILTIATKIHAVVRGIFNRRAFFLLIVVGAIKAKITETTTAKQLIAGCTQGTLLILEHHRLFQRNFRRETRLLDSHHNGNSISTRGLCVNNQKGSWPKPFVTWSYGSKHWIPEHVCLFVPMQTMKGFISLECSWTDSLTDDVRL